MRFRYDGGPMPVAPAAMLETAVAVEPARVWDLLDRADAAHRSGYGVALFLSYEFGYACVGLPAPVVRAVDDLPSPPSAALGIFVPNAADRATEAGADEPSADVAVAGLTPRTPRAAYDRSVAAIQAAIREGDVYQVNLTVPFGFRYRGEPAAIYRRLRAAARARESAYCEGEGWAIASLSPELFFSCTPERLTARPMKGTAARGAERELASAKNRAEHVMIVDLLRNDLGQLCSRVEVERLLEVETYPTFSTMTSTVVGARRPGTPLRETLAALFPCGSVTGAPKRAAMAAIAALETAPRGAYCGTLGYLLPDGVGRFNVAIRTLQFDTARGLGRLDLGGGIVADSRGDLEWAEVALKGRFLEALDATAADAARGTRGEAR